jgi:hypothetical protein
MQFYSIWTKRAGSYRPNAQRNETCFIMWRKRVQGRKTKHEKLRGFKEGRFKCTMQRQINNNKISKR